MKRSTDRILVTHAGSLARPTQAHAIEAANPRHEHEFQVWADVELPEGKILIPGLVSHATNVVEHPELIAWRIGNLSEGAALVSRQLWRA